MVVGPTADGFCAGKAFYTWTLSGRTLALKLVKDECDRAGLPIISVACVAVGLVSSSQRTLPGSWCNSRIQTSNTGGRIL